MEIKKNLVELTKTVKIINKVHCSKANATYVVSNIITVKRKSKGMNMYVK